MALDRNGLHVGLIPARAGKTRMLFTASALHPAHPRSRGENVVPLGQAAWVRGSSPLARGKPGAPHQRARLFRLIPARAGKTKPLNKTNPTLRAHPRSRGENLGAGVKVAESGGSSPLARGKLQGVRVRAREVGLIPARAGKTKRIIMGAKRSDGSSPLARGKRRGPPGGPQEDGLIPARAGKTNGDAENVLREQAHPRSRGENTVRLDDGCAIDGSSPLARGKR